eukprot:SAG11_NODE_26458_length_345_cov_0.613821_1_plen_65_part_01
MQVAAHQCRASSCRTTHWLVVTRAHAHTDLILGHGLLVLRIADVGVYRAVSLGAVALSAQEATHG